MNLHDVGTTLFPEGEIWGSLQEAGQCVEMHKLPKNTYPRNCEVIATGQFQFALHQECRFAYLVKVCGQVLLVRVFPESKHSSFAEITLRPASMADPSVKVRAAHGVLTAC